MPLLILSFRFLCRLLQAGCLCVDPEMRGFKLTPLRRISRCGLRSSLHNAQHCERHCSQHLDAMGHGTSTRLRGSNYFNVAFCWGFQSEHTNNSIKLPTLFKARFRTCPSFLSAITVELEFTNIAMMSMLYEIKEALFSRNVNVKDDV